MGSEWKLNGRMLLRLNCLCKHTQIVLNANSTYHLTFLVSYSLAVFHLQYWAGKKTTTKQIAFAINHRGESKRRTNFECVSFDAL